MRNALLCSLVANALRDPKKSPPVNPRRFLLGYDARWAARKPDITDPQEIRKRLTALAGPNVTTFPKGSVLMPREIERRKREGIE